MHTMENMNKRQGQVYLRHLRSLGERYYFRWLSFPPFFSHDFVWVSEKCPRRRHLPKHYCRLAYFEVPGLDHPVQRPFARLQTVVSGSPDALGSCREKCIYAPLNDRPCSQVPGILKRRGGFVYNFWVKNAVSMKKKSLNLYSKNLCSYMWIITFLKEKINKCINTV